MAVLAFDVGTSAIKSSLVKENGMVVESASVKYSTVSKNLTWVEQDPSLWWIGARTAIKELLSNNKNSFRKIDAIGVCGHMLGCLPVDAGGNPLRPAMIHADTRAIDEAEYIARAIGGAQMYKETGNILSAQSSISKVLWLKRNEPDVYGKTSRFLQSKDYLVSKLTGNIDVTDFSDASHAQLINIHKKAYLTDVFAELSLDGYKFSTIYSGTDVIGTVTEEAAKYLGISSGIPVIAGGGDGACANVGAGITTQKGDAYCSLGTTAWISYNADVPVIDDKSRIFNIMSLDGKSFGVFGTMQSAGKCVDWIKDLFKIKNEDVFTVEAEKAPPGSDNLIFLPYIEGERSPIFDPNARGIFFNINSEHNHTHFIRSVLEGVAFALRSILDVHNETHLIADIRVIGGGAKSDLWKRIISDVCKVNICSARAASNSVTSLGVALAACVGVGIHNSLEEAMMSLDFTDIIEPEHSNYDLYNKLYDKFLKLYPQVKSLY